MASIYQYAWKHWVCRNKISNIACGKVQTVFLENQRLELEFQNPTLDPERKCFERLGRFSILGLIVGETLSKGAI